MTKSRRCLLLLALAAIPAAVTLSACEKSSASEGPTEGDIPVRADQKGFTPSSVTLTANSRSTLVFTRTTDKTCATEVVFPELGIKKDLPLNVPVRVDVPTDKARTLVFQCGMAMLSGKVVIH